MTQDRPSGREKPAVKFGEDTWRIGAGHYRFMAAGKCIGEHWTCDIEDHRHASETEADDCMRPRADPNYSGTTPGAER